MFLYPPEMERKQFVKHIVFTISLSVAMNDDRIKYRTTKRNQYVDKMLCVRLYFTQYLNAANSGIHTPRALLKRYEQYLGDTWPSGACTAIMFARANRVCARFKEIFSTHFIRCIKNIIIKSIGLNFNQKASLYFYTVDSAYICNASNCSVVVAAVDLCHVASENELALA